MGKIADFNFHFGNFFCLIFKCCNRGHLKLIQAKVPTNFFFTQQQNQPNLPLPGSLCPSILCFMPSYLASFSWFCCACKAGEKPKHVGERADIGGLFGHHLVCGGQSWWGKQELYFLASSSIMYIDILEKNVLLTPSGSCFGNSKTNQTYFSKAEWPRPEGPRSTFFS